MKVSAILFFVGLILTSAYGFKFQDMPVKVQHAMSVCKTDMGITEEEMEHMMSANDSKVDCLYACVLKNLGAMDNHGMLDAAKIGTLASEFKTPDMTDDYVTRLATHCTEGVTPDMDECKLASAFMKCATDKDHTI